MPYLNCPRCRLTLYSGVAYAYPTSDACPRCNESLGSEPKRLLGWRRSGTAGVSAPAPLPKGASH